MADTKKYYNRGFIGNRKAPEGVKAAHGSLELGVLEVGTRQAGEKQVITINTIGSFAGPSGIAYALGDDVFANGDGTVFIHVNCWDYVRENVEKMNLQRGDRIVVYGWFTRNEYTTRSGEARVNVQVNAEKIEIFRRAAKKDEIADAETAPVPAPVNNPVPAAPAEEPVAPAFTIPEGLDTERLPFV